MLFSLELFLMVPSSVVVDIEFMILNNLKLDFIMFLEFFIKLRATFQKFVEKHQFNVISSCFKQILNNHVFNTISICTLLAPSSSSRTCRIFLKYFL